MVGSTILGRNKENLQKVASECAKSQGIPEPLLIPGELTNEADTKSILEGTIKHFGKLDVLVNNAGKIL